MVKIEVELFTDQGNNAVVRLPARRFPGVLIQGDTLRGLLEATNEALGAIEQNKLPDARDILVALAGQLKAAQDRYEAAISTEGTKSSY